VVVEDMASPRISVFRSSYSEGYKGGLSFLDTVIFACALMSYGISCS